MAIFLLSLAGLPPLAGFFGKFYLFSVAMRAGQNHGLLWLVALALLGSFISLYYYLIVLKVIFVDEEPQPETSLPSSSLGEGGDFLQKVTLTVLAGVVIFFGIMPTMLVARIMASLP
jgi:NADH-quinone oxidoreductase subunit N